MEPQGCMEADATARKAAVDSLPVEHEKQELRRRRRSQGPLTVWLMRDADSLNDWRIVEAKGLSLHGPLDDMLVFVIDDKAVFTEGQVLWIHEPIRRVGKRMESSSS